MFAFVVSSVSSSSSHFRFLCAFSMSNITSRVNLALTSSVDRSWIPARRHLFGWRLIVSLKHRSCPPCIVVVSIGHWYLILTVPIICCSNWCSPTVALCATPVVYLVAWKFKMCSFFLAPVFSRWFWPLLWVFSRYATWSLLSCHNMSTMWYYLDVALTYLVCNVRVQYFRLGRCVNGNGGLHRWYVLPFTMLLYRDRWFAHIPPTSIQCFLWIPAHLSCTLLV